MDINNIEEEMEDIAGLLRIMCQMIEDIYIVVEHFKVQKRHENSICKRLYQKS